MSSAKWYLPDGTLLYEENWDQTNRDGIYFTLDDHGRIRGIQEIHEWREREGLTNGLFIAFNPPVSPSYVAKYKDGIIQKEYLGRNNRSKPD